MEFRKTDLQIIRDYVTAQDHLQYTQLPEDVVCILLTHSNIPTKHPDIRLNLHMTIEEVKDKFRTHIGTPVEFQRLILKRNETVIGELNDNSKMLGFYSVESGMEIHVIDTDPYSLSRGGGLTDTSLIEKYKMSDEAYNQRKGTLREFIREQKEKDPNYKLKPKSSVSSDVPTEIPADVGPESIVGMKVGDRCQVMPGKRRGTVQFIGEVPQLKEGYWVGVVFDEPSGLTNGTVKGVQYFQCDENYGSFVRAKNMKVGDYPVRNILDDDEDEEDEEEGEGEGGKAEKGGENDDDEI